MPAIAALSVKKADEVTLLTYDALTGAAGDGSKAVWRQDTGAVAAMPVGHRAMLTFSAKNNGPMTARRMTLQFKVPYSLLNASTGRYETQDTMILDVNAVIPTAIPASAIAEFVHQGLNACSTVLIKDSIKAGYPPQ